MKDRYPIPAKRLRACHKPKLSLGYYSRTTDFEKRRRTLFRVKKSYCFEGGLSSCLCKKQIQGNTHIATRIGEVAENTKFLIIVRNLGHSLQLTKGRSPFRPLAECASEGVSDPHCRGLESALDLDPPFDLPSR